MTDPAMTNPDQTDPDEREENDEANDQVQDPAFGAGPEFSPKLGHTPHRLDHAALADALVDLPPVPPDFDGSEAVEETSDDDYRPALPEGHRQGHDAVAAMASPPGQTAPGQIVPGQTAPGQIAPGQIAPEKTAHFDAASASDPDWEERELTDEALNRAEAYNPTLDIAAHSGIINPPPLADLGPETLHQETLYQETLYQETLDQEAESGTASDPLALAAKLAARKDVTTQAEKDQLISEFIAAKVMELSDADDQLMDKLDFDDIAASKARLAAHRRSGFINARKFMFETSFDPVLIPAAANHEDAGLIDIKLEGEDLPPEPPPPPPPPPPPSFSEEELMTARSVAWSEGEASGRAAARQEINQTLNQNVERLAENITDLLKEREQQISHFGSEAGKIAEAMVSKLFPELARRGGAAEIEALLRSSIELVRERPKLTVTLAPQIQNMLEAKLQGLAESLGFSGQIVFVSDPNLGEADVRIEWGDGGVERLTQRTWQSITDLMEKIKLATG
ncbi:MAG: FliH/SctL family protein [Candidatus Symbiobacter sp.]|nr:FliH/SctL family protein [Candidatus Symbiobacter sp.]